MTEASFQPQGYLRFNLDQGKLSTPDKRRHLVIPADLIGVAGKGDGLEEAARSWGKEQGIHLTKLVGKEVLEQSPERFITELSHLLATLGWGWCELESWGGVLFVVVRQAPRGSAVTILNNFLSGAFSSASGQQLACVPIPEDGACRFLVTGPENAGAIRSWVDVGTKIGEVVSRMLAGEHLSDAKTKTGGR